MHMMLSKIGLAFFAIVTLNNGVAVAQSRNIIDISIDKKTLSIVASVTDARDGIRVTAFAPASDVRATSLVGNGRVLVNCPGQICQYVWSRSAMRGGDNDLVLTATTATGIQSRLPIKVTRP
jgi:hypothetical protein